MNALRKYVEERPGAIRRLAKAASVTDGQMSRIVSGQRGASVRVVDAISRETGIPVAEIVAGLVPDTHEPEQASA